MTTILHATLRWKAADAAVPPYNVLKAEFEGGWVAIDPDRFHYLPYGAMIAVVLYDAVEDREHIGAVVAEGFFPFSTAEMETFRLAHPGVTYDLPRKGHRVPVESANFYADCLIRDAGSSSLTTLVVELVLVVDVTKKEKTS